MHGRRNYAVRYVPNGTSNYLGRFGGNREGIESGRRNRRRGQWTVLGKTTELQKSSSLLEFLGYVSGFSDELQYLNFSVFRANDGEAHTEFFAAKQLRSFSDFHSLEIQS